MRSVQNRPPGYSRPGPSPSRAVQGACSSVRGQASRGRCGSNHCRRPILVPAVQAGAPISRCLPLCQRNEQVLCAKNPIALQQHRRGGHHGQLLSELRALFAPRDVKVRIRHGFPCERLLDHQRITVDNFLNRAGANVTKRAGFGHERKSHGQVWIAKSGQAGHQSQTSRSSWI